MGPRNRVELELKMDPIFFFLIIIKWIQLIGWHWNWVIGLDSNLDLRVWVTGDHPGSTLVLFIYLFGQMIRYFIDNRENNERAPVSKEGIQEPQCRPRYQKKHLESHTTKCANRWSTILTVFIEYGGHPGSTHVLFGNSILVFSGVVFILQDPSNMSSLLTHLICDGGRSCLGCCFQWFARRRCSWRTDVVLQLSRIRICILGLGFFPSYVLGSADMFGSGFLGLLVSYQL